ncbi:hypothetical protein ACRC7T_10140 [Segnochrobactraceae bacterium EtOH-i3]
MANRIQRIAAFVLHEVRHALPATLFFAIGFCFVLATQKLLLREEMLATIPYLAAIMAALVIGKAVLVADKMPFLRRFDRAPLIQPILFKAVVYWAFVFIARLLEGWVHYIFKDHQVLGFIAGQLEDLDWHRFVFIQAWIFVLFLIYTSVSELNRLLGEGQLSRVLFRYAPTNLQIIRRQRLRTLTRLSSLAGSHTEAELADPRNPAHAEVVALVKKLAARAPGEDD